MDTKELTELELYNKELLSPENKHKSVGEITQYFYKKYPQFDSNPNVKSDFETQLWKWLDDNNLYIANGNNDKIIYPEFNGGYILRDYTNADKTYNTLTLALKALKKRKHII